MSVEISPNTPLADALNGAIQLKLVEVGWGTGGAEDAALSEYIILMLVNNKTKDEIASDLAGDLLNLPPDDPVVRDFTSWLFDQVNILSATEGDGTAETHNVEVVGGDMDTDMGAQDASELNAPTGPRSMRNGNGNGNFRGGRDKRMFGQMSKAMDRSGEGVLHRVRQTGNERINTHGRGAPSGPRGGGLNRQNRNQNNRGGMANAVVNHAVAGGFPQWPMQGQQPSQLDVMAMLEQQSKMMFELSQQMMSGAGRGFNQQRRGGKSLFERTQHPRQKNNFQRGHNQGEASGEDATMDTATEGDDMDMTGGKREAPNADETTCKFNLHCTNKDCKFAHQSPAAPPGTSVDVNDICTFGAACKNRKCVGRHPSPAARLAHQGEQDCKFFPNCQNPRCPFRHPAMPLCRNGADCTTPNCKFTHVKTKCRFNPCLNPSCAFSHEEGQQGGFKDKVWTPEGGQHFSERKFVDEKADEELVQPETTDTDRTIMAAPAGQDVHAEMSHENEAIV